MTNKYITESGDQWDIIALKKMGSEKHAHLLMEVNYKYISTVIFEAGIVLKIPEVSNAITTNLPPWKR